MERLITELSKDGSDDRAFARIISGVRDARGKDIPFPLTEVVSVKAELNRQAKRLIKLGFHKELGLSESDYLASLPNPEPQPEAFRGRFDIPILVETRIPVKRQCKLAGIGYFLDGLDVRDWSEDPEKYRTPRILYLTWVQDGARNLDRSVRTVRQGLGEDERGGTEFEGIGFYLAHPEILEHHCIDLPGTDVGSGYAPYLHLWRGGPLLYCAGVGDASPHYGSISCGRQ